MLKIWNKIIKLKRIKKIEIVLNLPKTNKTIILITIAITITITITMWKYVKLVPKLSHKTKQIVILINLLIKNKNNQLIIIIIIKIVYKEVD